MLQLRNSSPFVPAIFGLADRRGVETLVVVVKATFELGDPPRLAQQQRAITLTDEYLGDPGASSLRYPSEVHLAKPGADVIVLGDAHAPRGQALTEVDLVVGVGDRAKRVRVHGDRFWTRGLRAIQPSPARPFSRMPMVYERAYGGRCPPAPGTQTFLAEPRNPVGVGFAEGRAEDEDQVLGQPLPNLDDPDAPLTGLGQTPPPVGFGAIAPSWQPRVAYAGTYDARWRETRAPFLPEDFDPRFFQVAAPGLSFDQPLRGGEPLSLRGFDPDGGWRSALPRCRLDIMARVAGEGQALKPALDTVVLEPDARRFTMTWRATLAVGERMLRVERVSVGLSELEGVER